VCVDEPNLAIVTEYMSLGSLWDILHPKNPTTLLGSLSWAKRLSILLDVARGMAFLHGCNPPVVHRDLKSHNMFVLVNLDLEVLSNTLFEVYLT
jgi:serine/threonine protein kinase